MTRHTLNLILSRILAALLILLGCNSCEPKTVSQLGAVVAWCGICPVLVERAKKHQLEPRLRYHRVRREGSTHELNRCSSTIGRVALELLNSRAVPNH